MTARSTPRPDDAWPITMVVRWRDVGYARREVGFWAMLLAALAWGIGVTLALGESLDPRVFLLPLLLALVIAWPLIRSRPADYELVLAPDRLVVRDWLARTPVVDVARTEAGGLYAAESGLDWRERIVLLTDPGDREILRARAGIAPVDVRNLSDPPVDWWQAHMPEGTSPGSPPLSLSIVSLLGAWWPRPDHRRSVRGNLGHLQPWKEADLRGYGQWERRQRIANGLVFLVGVLAVCGWGLAVTWPWTFAEAAAILPPAVVALVTAVRTLMR